MRSFQEKGIVSAMVVHMRHTRGHTGNRRSHHALSEPRVSKCADCGAPHMRHRACASCGKYRGKVVTDVVAAARKKDEKRKARTEAHADHDHSEKEEKKEVVKASK